MYISKRRQKRKDAREKWVRENPREYVLMRTKATAKYHRREFSLTLKDIVIPGRCPIFGFPISVANEDMDRCVSVTRIDKKKGYIKGNIVIISLYASKKMRGLTVNQLIKMANFYRRLS